MIDFKSAIKNLEFEKTSYWNNYLKNNSKKIKIPIHKAKFKIKKNHKIFTIGSCFARRIEDAFPENNNILSKKFFEIYSNSIFNKKLNINFINKYSTASILNELIFTFKKKYTHKYLLKEKNNNLCYDLQCAPYNTGIKYLDANKTLLRHEVITKTFEKIKDCDIIIITLGLIECWYDKKNKIYLNAGPLKKFLSTNEKKRFELKLLNYEENYSNLIKIYKLLKIISKRKKKIIITVSPVPLYATFSGKDVLTANTYSKSVLRSVAGEFANKYSDVDYFPSYEMCIASDKKLVYEKNQIEVKKRFAKKIVDEFQKNYFKKNNFKDRFVQLFKNIY